MSDALAELLADMGRDIDARLAAMRRVDALRSVASCTTAESAEAVRRRFEIAQLAGDDAGDAPAVMVLQ
jgi:hypothetical protein